MQIMGVRVLREKTGELARSAERGEAVLITKGGKPLVYSVPFDDALIQQGVAIKLAAQLFSQGAVTLVAGARLAGIGVEEFIRKLGALGIPAVDYDPADLDEELKTLG